MSIYGYARVSTEHQRLTRQLKNIKEYAPGAIIYKEHWTGTKNDRPAWIALKARVKEGDTIIFDSVSRMSRNAAEGVADYMDLYKRGVSLEFLKEPTINTSQYKAVTQVAMTDTDADLILEGVNKYLLRLAENQIKTAFEIAQKEVDDLHIRISEGIANSDKKPGPVKGTTITTAKETETIKIIAEYHKDFGGSLTDAQCMKLAGCCRNSYYKYKRKMSAE